MSKKPYMIKDFKRRQDQAPPATAGGRLHPLWHFAWVTGLFVGISLVALNDYAGVTKPDLEGSDSHSPPPDSAINHTNTVADSAADGDATDSEPGYWQDVVVRKGQSLGAIFIKLKLAPRILHEIMHADKAAKKLQRLKPGELLRFHIANNTLNALHYQPNPTYRLEIDIKDNQYVFAEYNRAYEQRTNIASGNIESSLFVGAQEAGISEAVTMEMAYIFGWDVDFALDIREGDKFTVVYEELFLDGAKVKDGNIIAAEFINNGKVLRALRYSDPDGKTDYFSPEGKNMRKTFLRTPVDFTRISSYFGKRKHPVLNRMRTHKGVDYAAPRGTAVKSTGNGKVVFRGRKGGYGKTVIVQHGSGYRTLYAHLNGFKRGVRIGTKVNQGQTIGFVGSSGLATGPHLHYEFLVNNVHRNPLRVKLPDARPINGKYMQDFRSKTMGLNALLDIVANSKLAMGSPGKTP